MELRDFIKGALDRAQQATTRAVDGLSYQELTWRPGAECNPMGLILFHQTRSEDNFVHSRVLGKPQVWESAGWYQKLNMPLSESGSGYTLEQVAAFRPPALKDILAYAEAVRARTLEYLKGATNADFDRVVTLPRGGDTSVGAIFTIIVVHLAQHAGELSYLRGQQRGANK